MGFLAIVNAYTMRICLSVAITEMVRKIPHDDNTNEDETCFIVGDPKPETSGGEYEWSENLQGVILSSFFWGYVITHIPGGMLAEKFGGKYVLSLGILSTAIFTLLTPLAIDWGEFEILEKLSFFPILSIYFLGGAPVLIALRTLEGFGEGTTYPALTALLAMWTPLSERSKLGSLVFGGGQVRCF